MANTIEVAIQGVAGSFHEMAAIDFFKGSQLSIIECGTFEDLFSLLERGGCHYGVVAVENSVAGILSHNFFMLNEYSLEVVGEYYLKIEQNLIALPGTTLEEIKEIKSHPIALRQCHLFLNKMRERGLLVTESADTASSVKELSLSRERGVAAVAGELAATLYGMDIIQRGIESNKRNFTRFIIVKAKNRKGKELSLLPKRGEKNKASISFILTNEPGMLFRVLQIFSAYNLNMTMIQSLPYLGREWEYRFFADFVFDDVKLCRKAISSVKRVTGAVWVSGIYSRGDSPY
ncbi:MAG: prephenate dehydratase [Bacteroidales bacterium]